MLSLTQRSRSISNGMRTVRDISHFQDVPILVRTALNVPLEKGGVTNDYRLRRAIPTIRYLCDRGARVVLISHIGEQGTETLEPVALALGKLLPHVSFFGETIGPRARAAVRDLRPGHVLVLENLRRDRGEKMNAPLFAKELAMLADIFVQDSFDTCHRLHASIVGVPKLLPSYAGLLLEEELLELRKALSPAHPSLAVIAGAKFATKEGVLSTLLKTYDRVFVGGALASDFFKAEGHEVGRSIVPNDNGEAIRKIVSNEKLILPVDSLVIPTNEAGTPCVSCSTRISSVGQVHPDEAIVDHGPGTIALLSHLVAQAKTILWNGPLGNYENGFTATTSAFAQAVADSHAYSVVGGGDTIAAIEGLGLLPKFSFVSTGGGAMLNLLADGSLPGVEVLNQPIA